MLIIRFTRRGRRNDPSFRLVVTERSNPAKGKFLEELGFYNPKLKIKSFKNERVLYWISKGAKCSATVNNLLISSEVIQGKKVKAWRPKKKVAPEAGKGEAKEEKKAPEAAAEPAPETVKAEVKEEKTPKTASDVKEEPVEEVTKEEKKEETTESPAQAEQKEEKQE